MEGTSQACPHISGVAALGLSYAAELHRHFRADEFRKMILESVNPVEPYFKETKVYWYTNASFGQIAAGQMEPAAYAGNMGTGLIDAYKLLKAVEGGGVEMTVPNSMWPSKLQVKSIIPVISKMERNDLYLYS